MIPSEVVEAAGRPCSELAVQLLEEWFGVTAGQAEALIADWANDCHRSPESVARVLVRQVWQGKETAVDAVVARRLEDALRSLPGLVGAGLDSVVETAPAGSPSVAGPGSR